MNQAPRILGSFRTLDVDAYDVGDGDTDLLANFRDRVRHAAKAGFTALGFRHDYLARLHRQDGLSEMKHVLDDHGIIDVELEWLTDWFRSDDRRAASDETRRMLLGAAEVFGARHIKVTDIGNDCADIPELAEAFGLLCRQAADRGTLILFELMPAPLSRAPTLDGVIEICRRAGAPNGGVMLDNLLLHRAGVTPLDLTRGIGPDIPLGVEISDGFTSQPVDLEDALTRKRLFPGDGELDVAAFLAAVWSVGYDGPIGVEVINPYVRRWSPERVADEAYGTTSAYVARARSRWEAGRADGRRNP